MLKVALRKFFGRPSGPDLREGVTFTLHGSGPRLVFGRITYMNNDELAHRGITRAKGASGFKLCSLCANIHDSKRSDRSGRLLPHTSLEVNKFVANTDESIRFILKALEAWCVQWTIRAKRVAHIRGYRLCQPGV